jgi:hypothetical protein
VNSVFRTTAFVRKTKKVKNRKQFFFKKQNKQNHSHENLINHQKRSNEQMYHATEVDDCSKLIGLDYVGRIALLERELTVLLSLLKKQKEKTEHLGLFNSISFSVVGTAALMHFPRTNVAKITIT